MFRIKICGVRRPADVTATDQAGADAVGFNFFRQSVRYISPADAADLSREAESRQLLRVGVFVDEPTESILAISDSVGLDMVQLHGHESPQDASRLMDAGERVLRAVRLPVGRLEADEIEERVAPWRALGCDLLLDADAGAQGGGAGFRLDWAAVGRWQEIYASKDVWALAGGLTPQSVAKAIAASHAVAVDVASGVEMPKGTKSNLLIEAFVAATGF